MELKHLSFLLDLVLTAIAIAWLYYRVRLNRWLDQNYVVSHLLYFAIRFHGY